MHTQSLRRMFGTIPEESSILVADSHVYVVAGVHIGEDTHLFLFLETVNSFPSQTQLFHAVLNECSRNILLWSVKISAIAVICVFYSYLRNFAPSFLSPSYHISLSSLKSFQLSFIDYSCDSDFLSLYSHILTRNALDMWPQEPKLLQSFGFYNILNDRYTIISWTEYIFINSAEFRLAKWWWYTSMTSTTWA